jgi:hypothetical protein
MSANKSTTDDEVKIIVDVPRELRQVPEAKPPRCAASPIPVFTSISRAHVRVRIYTLDVPAAAVLTSHATKRQLARRPPTDDPASTCTHGDHDYPARTQPSARVARSFRPRGRGLGRIATERRLHHYPDCCRCRCNPIPVCSTWVWISIWTSMSLWILWTGPQIQILAARQHHRASAPPSPAAAHCSP